MITGTLLEVLIVLAFVLLLWFPQNVQHESMHSIFAILFGAKDVKIHPFPTWEDDFFPKYWAHMTFSSGGKFKDWQYGLFSCAPQLANTVIMLVLFATIIFTNMPTLAYLFFLAMFITNFTDGAFNLGSLAKKKTSGNDAWSAVHYFKIDIRFARIFVFLWYAIFICLGLLLII